MAKSWMLLAAAVIILSSYAESNAQVAKTQPTAVGTFGMGLVGGAIIPQSVSFRGSGSVMGLPLNSSGHITLDPGPVVGGYIEYQFDEHFNIQGALGYSAANLHTFQGNLNVGPIGPLSGPFSLKGDTSIIAGFANILYNPLGIEGEFTPFIGGGPGIANPRSNITAVNVNGFSLPLNVKSHENDFAADMLVGADFRVDRQWNVGAFYQFLWINSRHLGSGGTVVGSSGRVMGHILGALIEYRF